MGVGGEWKRGVDGGKGSKTGMESLGRRLFEKWQNVQRAACNHRDMRSIRVEFNHRLLSFTNYELIN